MRFLVCIQGKFEVSYQQGSLWLPASLILPKAFPNVGPAVQIPYFQKARGKANIYIQENGTIDSNRILKWVPLHSTILNFLQALQAQLATVIEFGVAKQVSGFLPATPNPADKFFESGLQQSAEILKTVEGKCREKDLLLKKNACLKFAIHSCQQLTSDVASKCNGMQQEIDNTNSELSKDIKNQILNESYESGFNDTLEFLEGRLVDSSINFAEYSLTAYQLYLAFFKDCIYPQYHKD